MKMLTITEIREKIKRDILVGRLELQDVRPEDIADDEALFGGGLGLDSVEALDVVAGLEEVFGVKLLGATEQEFREHMSSVSALADYVSGRLAEAV